MPAMWKPFTAYNNIRYGGAPDHWLAMTGKCDLSGGRLTIDNGRFYLWENSPGDTFCLIRQRGAKNATLAEAVFFAHCMGYEHDTPCGLQNRRGQRLVKPLFGKMTRNQYDEEMQHIAVTIVGMRLGNETIHFRRPRGEKEWDVFDLPYTARYGAVAEPIRMYGTALWQADPLSEFVHYYRVVERLGGGGNGKTWITNSVQRLATHDFGNLYAPKFVTREIVNVFGAWRRRATSRLKQLGLSPSDLAKHLWNTTRCGIAHGGGPPHNNQPITIDFGAALSSVVKDLPIMKLLARMAIDDNATTKRSKADDGKPDW